MISKSKAERFSIVITRYTKVARNKVSFGTTERGTQPLMANIRVWRDALGLDDEAREWDVLSAIADFVSELTELTNQISVARSIDDQQRKLILPGLEAAATFASFQSIENYSTGSRAATNEALCKEADTAAVLLKLLGAKLAEEFPEGALSPADIRYWEDRLLQLLEEVAAGTTSPHLQNVLIAGITKLLRAVRSAETRGTDPVYEASGQVLSTAMRVAKLRTLGKPDKNTAKNPYGFG